LDFTGEIMSSTNFILKKLKEYKKEVFELMVVAGKGHVPSSFSISEILATLMYGGFINLNKENLKEKRRDRIIISKGHAAMALYPIFKDLGFFDEKEMALFTKPEGLLRLYADPSIPGIETVTGSLGNGFGIGCGMALSAKKDKRDSLVVVILGDGECYEGSVWETALLAAHQKLENLLVIVDRNKLCIMDETEKCVELGDMKAKWQAFGWDSCDIDGHSINDLFNFLSDWKNKKRAKPFALIAHTVKGKGISYMENQPLWHNKIPNQKQIEQARLELA